MFGWQKGYKQQENVHNSADYATLRFFIHKYFTFYFIFRMLINHTVLLSDVYPYVMKFKVYDIYLVSYCRLCHSVCNT